MDKPGEIVIPIGPQHPALKEPESFLIPLEGDATQQEKFQSEEYLKQRKVAALLYVAMMTLTSGKGGAGD